MGFFKEVLIMQSNNYQNCNKLIIYNNDPYLFGVLVNLLKMNTLHAKSTNLKWKSTKFKYFKTFLFNFLKSAIHEFDYPTKCLFSQSTKIGTNEIKWIHMSQYMFSLITISRWQIVTYGSNVNEQPSWILEIQPV